MDYFAPTTPTLNIEPVSDRRTKIEFYVDRVTTLVILLGIPIALILSQMVSIALLVLLVEGFFAVRWYRRRSRR